MESTAVTTSVQPAPMTRRARREAEQRAQALREHGARGHVTHPAMTHPPATRPPAPYPPAPYPPVTQPPVTHAPAGRLPVTQAPVPRPQAVRPSAPPRAGLPQVAETRVAFAALPLPVQPVAAPQFTRAAAPFPAPAQVTPAPLPVPAPVVPVPVPAPAPAAADGESFDHLVTGAVPRQSRPTSSIPVGQRLISRATVIGTLACATIAAPFAQGMAQSGESPFEVDAPRTGPNVLDLVTQPVERPETSGAVVRAEAITRPESAASRSFDRSPLPDCDVDAPVDGTNGALADHSLCELWQAGEYLRPDAAMSLSALNEAFRAAFGREMCLVASYRDLDTQYELKASRGYFAASPGTSMHGWGLAIDLCSKETGDSEVFSWLWANAPSYGWQNPSWAQLGGSKYEPWHWEFVSGVVEKGEWHG